MKKLIALLLIFNITIFELDLYSSEEKLSIPLRNVFISSTLALRAERVGHISDLATSYKRERKLAPDVQVTFYTHGKALDPDETYTKDLLKNNISVTTDRKWRIVPTGTAGIKAFLITTAEGNGLSALKDLIRHEIETDKLAPFKFYNVSITKNGSLISDRHSETIPFTESLESYGVIINKSKLICNVNDNQLILQFIDIPNLKLYKATKPDIYIENISIYTAQDGNKLKIKLDSDDAQLKKENTGLIDDPQNYQCYHDYLYFLNIKDSWNSDDFTNPKTLQLYEFGKQIIALWASKNGFSLLEEERLVPVLKSLPVETLAATKIETSPITKNLPTQRDKTLSTQLSKNSPMQPSKSFWQRWTSRQAWSDWWQSDWWQSNWWRTHRTKLLGTLGITAAGSLGLYMYTQKGKTLLPTIGNVPK